MRHPLLRFACLLVASLGARSASAAPADFARVGPGLGGLNYYMSYSPFNDLVKTARWLNVAGWDERGYPTGAVAGKTVNARIGVDAGDTFPAGEYVLTWRGGGEARLDRPHAAELVHDETDDGVHRRVYRVPQVESYGFEIEIDAFPVSDLHLYLPGTETLKSRWNPAYLAVIEPFRGSHLRFMDLGLTNHSEQRDWADRTPADWPTYVQTLTRSDAKTPVKGGAAWEAMVELCNQTGNDLWLCVPHLATDDYVRNLAALVRTGVDPATGEQTGEPLEEGLRVWVEYSNEVWNWQFQQTKWVDQNVPGERVEDKYMAKALNVFRIFEREFGGTDRLVRVVGTHTNHGKGWKTRKRFEAAEPGRDFDVLAITTYFSHGMEEWAMERWPVTPEAFMDELELRLGSGPFRKDEFLPDNHAPAHQYELAAKAGVPVVSYEGNSHLIASKRVLPPEPELNGQGKPKKVPIYDLKPAFVDFLFEVERTPRFAGLYERWLERHEASGLASNTPFVLVHNWNRNGQWGHMEHLGQPLDEAVKYRMLIEHYGLTPPAAEPR
ncbi:hypothetical protein [Phycisphaera mikurensis]|uniref:Uncharacterized protein n=1 Tax=Phycisphaera mikurensis (strain NBRC 102666 / KCTC 22515 / FYK2301M01) TaxID=1142394 RepID=I0ICY3_PHYMF|nr:hypothetical protein [Phycisphaera mikurensis]MBB6442251.1 hypothetical protein [Phycisphaera mikurensis]BAM03121.1 hypothetical protein PSMK_09620 [Phycisphaera mikurensis NBRC 102666]